MKNIVHDQDYREITSRIERLDSNSKALWGNMNCNQMLCHCADVLREALGTRPTKNLGNFFSHTFMKWFSFYILTSWPKGKLPTSPSYDSFKGGTPVNNLKDDKDVLLKLLSNVRSADSLKPHPYFGNLTKKEWGRITYLHLNHHLKQFGV
ncbi:MAG TPA: DUF1569 domain-containing protein [Bacteroidia bacterium]|nr:DUF1569 domain-containing protein [Bacteroidia bacterium]